MYTPLDLRWPGGARASVALAFDLDGPTGAAMLDGSIWHKPEYFTFGGYGPYRALPRLLDMLAAHRTPATFFVPAWVVEQWPRQCQAIVEGGHEVACHRVSYALGGLASADACAAHGQRRDLFEQHAR
jgi:peptidoglycan/xylan/chitin deacetylase (PgdA/CDA1 family)